MVAVMAGAPGCHLSWSGAEKGRSSNDMTHDARHLPASSLTILLILH